MYVCMRFLSLSFFTWIAMRKFFNIFISFLCIYSRIELVKRLRCECNATVTTFKTTEEFHLHHFHFNCNWSTKKAKTIEWNRVWINNNETNEKMKKSMKIHLKDLNPVYNIVFQQVFSHSYALYIHSPQS